MYTILIVEDELFVSLGIVNSIDWAAHGFQKPLTAVNGREAWEMMQRQPVHVVMTDIKMPEMDGIQLIKTIRESDYQTEVIILSSYTDFEYVSGALELQTCSYLHKPAMMPADIALAIDKAVVRIESLKQRELTVKQMEHLYQTSAGKLKERALLDLVNGVEKSERQLDDLSFNVNMQACHVAVVHLNNGVSILNSKFNGIHRFLFLHLLMLSMNYSLTIFGMNVFAVRPI
jgi:two-component system response regulator YesN